MHFAAKALSIPPNHDQEVPEFSAGTGRINSNMTPEKVGAVLAGDGE